MNGETPPDQSPRLWVIHFSFVSTIPIFLFLSIFVLHPALKTSANPFIPSARALMVYAVLAFLSLMAIIFAFTIESWMRTITPASIDASLVYLNKRTVELIIMDAFIQSIAIYGLVGLFLGLQSWQAYSLIAVSLIFLLIVIARIKIWIEEYRQRVRSDIHPV